MKHLRKFNEGTYQAHSTIPDANSKAYDKLQAGVKKYGMDSKFMKEYKALCQQARYEDLDSFFARWGIQATNEAYNSYGDEEIERWGKKIAPDKKKMLDKIWGHFNDIESDLQYQNFRGGIDELDSNTISDIERVLSTCADRISEIIEIGGGDSLRGKKIDNTPTDY